MEWPLFKISMMSSPLKLTLKADPTWWSFPLKLECWPDESWCSGLLGSHLPREQLAFPGRFPGRQQSFPCKGPFSRIAMATAGHHAWRIPSQDILHFRLIPQMAASSPLTSGFCTWWSSTLGKTTDSSLWVVIPQDYGSPFVNLRKSLFQSSRTEQSSRFCKKQQHPREEGGWLCP